MALDSEGKTGVAYGITGVPESFLVDPQGKIAWHAAAALAPEQIDAELLPLLDQ